MNTKLKKECLKTKELSFAEPFAGNLDSYEDYSKLFSF